MDRLLEARFVVPADRSTTGSEVVLAVEPCPRMSPAPRSPWIDGLRRIFDFDAVDRWTISARRGALVAEVVGGLGVDHVHLRPPHGSWRHVEETNYGRLRTFGGDAIVVVAVQMLSRVDRAL